MMSFSSALVFGILCSSQVLAAPVPPCNTTAVANPPPSLNCQVQARLSRPVTPIVAPFNTTYNGCRDACISSNKCVSFGYNTKKSLCITYPKTLISQGIRKDNSSGIYYSNRHCFKKTCLSCPRDQTFCSGESCSDLSNDNDNCGSCGNTCDVAKGQTCQSGTCTDSCNNSCGGEVCSSGQCLCPARTPLQGLPDCGQSCYIDYSSDDENCGSCGNVCQGISTCKAGVCGVGNFGIRISDSSNAAGTKLQYDGGSYPLFSDRNGGQSFFLDENGRLLHSPDSSILALSATNSNDAYAAFGYRRVRVTSDAEIGSTGGAIICAFDQSFATISCQARYLGVTYNKIGAGTDVDTGDYCFELGNGLTGFIDVEVEVYKV